MKLVIGLFISFLFAGRLFAADQSVPIDTSPQAVEAAYQAVRAGDAVPVATLKQTAEGLLVKLINAATVAGDFLADQIPQVVRELLLYNTAYYTFLCLLGIAMALLGLYGSNKYWKFYISLPVKYSASCTTRQDVIPLPHLAWGAFVPGFVMFLGNIDDLLKITLAPRVWLIEYAASLVK